MEANVILVDSDVLIAHLRGDERITRWLETQRETVGVLTTSAVASARSRAAGDRASVGRFGDS